MSCPNWRLILFAVTCLVCAPCLAEEPLNKQPDSEVPLAQRIYQSASPSIVTIEGTNRDGKKHGVGTGFVFGEQRLIATNLHVIGHSRDFRVKTRDGKILPVKAIHAFDGTLDLAILETESHELPALSLSEELNPAIGQNVIVLGNPQGYENSVVAGILSATRTLDSQELLQLAIPIEPGNSGGPALNSSGEVLGIVSMKSSVTDNLGFAVSVKHLQQLLDDPNPIDFKQWLTLGLLDKSAWQPLFGARWTQRAGRILVESPGEGFGGRALCLKNEVPKELPYEISVQVRLNEKDGAAGLAFLSDGHSRHFGLYPSSGRLRVTRFDGPTVYQWKVLEEADVVGVDMLDWTHLKVRVEQEHFSCFVNDQLIYQSTYDKQRFDPLSSFGLVKFRHTSAEFRKPSLGVDLPNFSPDEELLSQWQAKLSTDTKRADITDDILATWATTPDTARFALSRKAEKLRQEAEQLERLAEDVHLASVVSQLTKQLDSQEFNLFDAAMLVALVDDVQLDVDAYRNQFARLKKQLSETLPKDARPVDKLAHLNDFLFTKNGFHGSRSEYYSRSNSYLSRVLDDREGIPVTLSAIYLELAAAIDLPAEGIGIPGHFLVRVHLSEDQDQLIDVFDRGRKLTRKEIDEQIRTFTGLPPRVGQFEVYDNRRILERILSNLAANAQRQNDLPSLAKYYQLMTVVDPDSMQYQGMKALVLYQTGRKAAAIEQLDWLDANMRDEIGNDRLRQMRTYFESGH